MFYVHLKRVCITLVWGGVFCVCVLDLTGLFFRSLFSYWSVSFWPIKSEVLKSTIIVELSIMPLLLFCVCCGSLWIYLSRNWSFLNLHVQFFPETVKILSIISSNKLSASFSCWDSSNAYVGRLDGTHNPLGSLHFFFLLLWFSDFKWPSSSLILLPVWVCYWTPLLNFSI